MYPKFCSPVPINYPILFPAVTFCVSLCKSTRHNVQAASTQLRRYVFALCALLEKLYLYFRLAKLKPGYVEHGRLLALIVNLHYLQEPLPLVKQVIYFRTSEEGVGVSKSESIKAND